MKYNISLDVPTHRDEIPRYIQYVYVRILIGMVHFYDSIFNIVEKYNCYKISTDSMFDNDR